MYWLYKDFSNSLLFHYTSNAINDNLFLFNNSIEIERKLQFITLKLEIHLRVSLLVSNFLIYMQMLKIRLKMKSFIIHFRFEIDLLQNRHWHWRDIRYSVTMIQQRVRIESRLSCLQRNKSNTCDETIDRVINIPVLRSCKYTRLDEHSIHAFSITSDARVSSPWYFLVRLDLPRVWEVGFWCAHPLYGTVNVDSERPGNLRSHVE